MRHTSGISKTEQVARWAMSHDRGVTADEVAAHFGMHVTDAKRKLQDITRSGRYTGEKLYRMADAAGLCLKSGNAVLLRGGSEAISSNLAMLQVLVEAGEAAGLPSGAIQMVTTTDREAVQAMLRLNRYLDVIIPRGGAGLIRTVVENSTVPVIETGTGVCHTYVDDGADLAMAEEIAFNAKVSRPSVCNAMETLLVHRCVAKRFCLKCWKAIMLPG